MNKLLIFAFLVVATTLECSGDAIVRMGLTHQGLAPRLMLFLTGAALLFAYAVSLNLAPIDFGRVVGPYVAVLFVVWQIINFVAFRSLPTMSILIGGAIIVAGGGLIAFWQR